MVIGISGYEYVSTTEELTRELTRVNLENQRLREALKPFALNPGAISLRSALGHIEREDLLRAKAALDSKTGV